MDEGRVVRHLDMSDEAVGMLSDIDSIQFTLDTTLLEIRNEFLVLTTAEEIESWGDWQALQVAIEESYEVVVPDAFAIDLWDSLLWQGR